jgi:hypothetical protein
MTSDFFFCGRLRSIHTLSPLPSAPAVCTCAPNSSIAGCIVANAAVFWIGVNSLPAVPMMIPLSSPSSCLSTARRSGTLRPSFRNTSSVFTSQFSPHACIVPTTESGTTSSRLSPSNGEPS